jgi:universal stress protein F
MYNNILVPVLFDEGHDAQASYLVARALADEGAKFTVVHVREEIPSYITSITPSEVLEKTHHEIEKSLVQSAKALPGAVPMLTSGHAGRAIVDYASENNTECIVMASHKPGVEDLFLGSTAARVVRHAKCSVHVIR